MLPCKVQCVIFADDVSFVTDNKDQEKGNKITQLALDQISE